MINGQLAAFQAQTQRGQDLSRESLYPGTITFPSHAAIACAHRSGTASAALDEGFEETNIQVFWVLRSLLPAGISLNPKITKFTDENSNEWRLVSFNDEASDAHVRLVAEVSAHK